MLARVSSVVFLILLAAAPLRPQQLPDFAQAREEVVARLQDLIRLDTTNPPGNETLVAEYLKRILDREGIEAEIFAVEPSRGNLVARLRGNGSKRPLLLMAHTDVVGVDRDKWTVEPFAGLIQDGYVYGRGAADDKDDVAAMLQVLLLIHRRNIPLDRDIIFLAEAGEEGTTAFGIDFIVEKHWDKIDAEFALNEGGRTLLREGKVQYVGVQTAEKIPRRLRLVARGVSGHGSVPRMDNPIYRLSAAVARVAEYQPPMRLNETTRVFFNRLAQISPPAQARLFANIEHPVEGPRVQEMMRRSQDRALLMYNSMLGTSISPNIIQGGFRSNVIPAEAEVTLDVRALPDEDFDAFLAELRRVIDDPAVEIVREPVYRAPAPASPLNSELYQTLEKIQQTMFPEAITLPIMSTGATDSSQLRAKGVLAYGIGPPATDEDSERLHGDDERVSIEGLGTFLEFLYRAVVEVAAAR